MGRPIGELRFGGYGCPKMPDRPSKRGDRGSPHEPAEQSTEPSPPHEDPRPANGDRVDIGPVSLNVPAQWQFYPLEDRVIGRHSSKVGVLQIKVLPSAAAPRDSSHEMFMAVARDMSGYELSG